jgi:polar amino acid transport system substrate-binding protein
MAERIEKVEFTKPYLNNQQGLAVAKDSPYQKKEDLVGKIVGAQTMTSGLDALNADPVLSTGAAEIAEYDDYLMALLDLGTTRLDAVAVDKILIGYVMAQEPANTESLTSPVRRILWYWLSEGCRCPQGSHRQYLGRII